MKLRCRPGDLAIVIRDDVGHEANLGRIVRVSGPVETNRRGMRTWLIKPVDAREWAVGPPGAVPTYMAVRFSDGVEHPDQWLLPIRGRTAKARSARKTASRTDSDKKRVRRSSTSRRRRWQRRPRGQGAKRGGSPCHAPAVDMHYETAPALCGVDGHRLLVPTRGNVRGCWRASAVRS